jgi:hypothetical protein
VLVVHHPGEREKFLNLSFGQSPNSSYLKVFRIVGTTTGMYRHIKGYQQQILFGTE